MIDIPPAVSVNSLFSGEYSVCWFKDTTYQEDAPPHYYVSIPITDEQSLLLGIITSKVEKRTKYYSWSEKLLASLIKVNQSLFSFLKKESILDCNDVKIIAKDELLGRIDPAYGFKIFMRDGAFPGVLKDHIKTAIINSPKVNTFIKKLLA